MNRLFVPLLALSLVLASGCGGSVGGFGDSVSLTPQNATMAPSGTQVFEVVAVETFASDAEWSVKEANGGTIVSNNNVVLKSATYTAPSTPGTYHVRAVVTLPNKTKTIEATVVVSP